MHGLLSQHWLLWWHLILHRHAMWVLYESATRHSLLETDGRARYVMGSLIDMSKGCVLRQIDTASLDDALFACTLSSSYELSIAASEFLGVDGC